RAFAFRRIAQAHDVGRPAVQSRLADGHLRREERSVRVLSERFVCREIDLGVLEPRGKLIEYLADRLIAREPWQQEIERPTDSLGLRVPEHTLTGHVERSNVPLSVDRHDDVFDVIENGL